MTALACIELALDYPGVPVLAGIDLAIADGEVVALLGASGSGKTTLIHAVAGFIAPTTGEIWLGGSLVSTPSHCVAPERRRVGMVFQNYALWPHMTALETVAYPLRRAGIGHRAAYERAREILDRVGVGALAERRPAEISGGEQQRVGLARALARDAGLYVFDEPSAHLDAHLRATVLDEFARQRGISGGAALYATHDASEALAIADRVAVLHNGRLAQLAAPAEVYAQPADLHVAQLTGIARTLTARIDILGSDSIDVTVGSVSTAVPCANALWENGSMPLIAGGSVDGGSVDARTVHDARAVHDARTVHDARAVRDTREQRWAALLVRPEWAALGGDLPGRVVAVRYHGPDTDHHLETPVGTVIVRSPGTPQLSEGDRTTWSLLRCWRM